MVEGVSDPASMLPQIRARIPTHVRVLVNLIAGGKTPPIGLSELESFGANVVLYSTPALFIAHKAIADYMTHLKETDCVLSLEDGASGIAFSESNATGQKGTRMAAGISFPAPVIASPVGSSAM